MRLFAFSDFKARKSKASHAFRAFLKISPFFSGLFFGWPWGLAAAWPKGLAQRHRPGVWPRGLAQGLRSLGRGLSTDPLPRRQADKREQPPPHHHAHKQECRAPPPPPRIVKGFAPKDLLAHAEAPASKDTNECKAHPTTPTLSRQTRLPQDLPGDCEGTGAEFGKDFPRIP